MINLCDLSELFTKLELATLMTAAICHDLDHPGFNNKYALLCLKDLCISANLNHSPTVLSVPSPVAIRSMHGQSWRYVTMTFHL